MVTKAVVALHKHFMKIQRLNGEHDYCPPGFADQDGYQVQRRGDWRASVQGYTGLAPIHSLGSNNYSRTAKDVREEFKKYFNSPESAVSCQQDHISRTINPFDEEY